MSPPRTSPRSPSEADRAGHGWATAAALSTLALGLSLLGVWLLGGAGGAAWAGPRMKTNTALSMILLAGGLLAQVRAGAGAAPDRRAVVGRVAAALAALLGGASLLEYVVGAGFGIDQLLARDSIIAESARFPNRMSPNGAISIALLGLALLWVRSPRRALTRASQALALIVLGISMFALIGYWYGAEELYKPTPFIRISPWTAGGLLAVCGGLLALQRHLGLMRIIAGRNLAGVLVRPLLLLTTVLPIVFGWMMVRGQAAGLFGPVLGSALLVIATIIGLFGVIGLLARWIDALEARRNRAEDELRRAALLAGELTQAATVEEIIDVAVRVGIPALGASAGGVLMASPDGAELRVLRSSNLPADAVRAYDTQPVAGHTPSAVAFRRREPIFIATREQFLRQYPEVTAAHAGDDESRVALPLAGRERTLGVLALTFKHRQRFDEARRARILGLASQCGLALDRALLLESEKGARERAEHARVEAETANRAKDEFLAMLGHELRNPLAPILTSIELMNLRGDGPSQERTVIARQVRHMTRLVDDLLDVSRITRGKVELRRRRIELAECVTRAIEIASPLLEERQHHLTIAVPLQGLPVRADPQRLEQVISNLLTNAGKYTNPGGQIQIVARADGERVVLTVRDDGIGIAGDLLPHVFDLFTQGHHSFDRAQGGLGLGLAIVSSMVQMHGGTVWAESDGPGRGSAFSIALPLDAEERGEERSPTPDPGVAPAGSERAAGCRVLVVDDNQDAAELLAEVLRLHGHEVRIALDGPAALALVGELHPELAFLDLGLPVMDGFDLARRLRAGQGSRPLTLIAVTGYGQDSDRARSAAAGFDRHLVKPVEIEETLAIADQIAAARDRPAAHPRSVNEAP